MIKLKNIFVGFLVSFIGSLPLGYLNIVGFEIYEKWGINNLVPFILGIILIEIFVIYYTLIFANQLVSNKKLMKIIDILAVFFLLILAFSFYFHSKQNVSNPNYLEKFSAYSPFIIGIFLNCLNFLQIPFWAGWNLYLTNSNYISTENKRIIWFYVLGTAIGIFFGMLGIILVLHSFSEIASSLSAYLFPVVFPVFFVVLALIQAYKVYKKYFKKAYFS